MGTGRFGVVCSPMRGGFLIGRGIAATGIFTVAATISTLAAPGALLPRDAGSAGSNGTTMPAQWDNVGGGPGSLPPPPRHILATEAAFSGDKRWKPNRLPIRSMSRG